MTRWVVAGTDTGVGKTVFAAALAAALDGVYWKPVQAGVEDGRTDRAAAAALSRLPPSRFPPETWRLETPVSPHQAAAIAGVRIDADALTPPVCDRPLVIETAGGVLVPLNPDRLFADVLARWGLPVIVCAPTRLGMINHSLLTLEALRARGVPVRGVAFIGPPSPEAEAAVVRFGAVQRLGRLPWLAPLTPSTLAEAFDAAFDRGDFR